MTTCPKCGFENFTLTSTLKLVKFCGLCKHNLLAIRGTSGTPTIRANRKSGFPRMTKHSISRPAFSNTFLFSAQIEMPAH